MSIPGFCTEKRAIFEGSYRFHAHDGLLHLGDVGDVVFVGAQLPQLYSLVDPHHHVPGDVSSVVDPWNINWDSNEAVLF